MEKTPGRIKKISTKASAESVSEPIRATRLLIDSSSYLEGDPSAILAISSRLLLGVSVDDTSIVILDVHSGEELTMTSQLQTISSSSMIIEDIPMAEPSSDRGQVLELVVTEGSSLREPKVCITPPTIYVLKEVHQHSYSASSSWVKRPHVYSYEIEESVLRLIQIIQQDFLMKDSFS